jgi:hypothetical protein
VVWQLANAAGYLFQLIKSRRNQDEKWIDGAVEAIENE